MDLGNKLKELRTQRHLSQEIVAQKLDVSRQAVAKWESNASKPSTANLVSLCEFYGVSLNDLIPTEIQSEQKNHKTKNKTLIVILSVLVVVFLFLSLALTVWTKHNSVPDNVIGYADASTAIFITSSPWYLFIVYGLAFAVLLALVIILVKK